MSWVMRYTFLVTTGYCSTVVLQDLGTCRVTDIHGIKTILKHPAFDTYSRCRQFNLGNNKNSALENPITEISGE